MRIKRTIAVDICDCCKVKESHSQKCLNCGKAVCFECERGGHGKDFRHSIHCSGSGDGFYCSECVPQMIASGEPLFMAYRSIQLLSAEYEAYYKEFEKRAEIAKAAIARLRKERGL